MNVGTCAFESLNLLTVLDLRLNHCINELAGTRAAVLRMMPTVTDRCRPNVGDRPRDCVMLQGFNKTIPGVL
jgi:hypothetical protein